MHLITNMVLLLIPSATSNMLISLNFCFILFFPFHVDSAHLGQDSWMTLLTQHPHKKRVKCIYPKFFNKLKMYTGKSGPSFPSLLSKYFISDLL